MGSLETQCLVQVSTVGPAPVLVTLAQITLMGTPVKLTSPLTRSSVTANKATRGHAVPSVPLVTMGTQNKPVGSASRAIAMATSTLRTLSHVTPGQANASSACITPTARPVLTVNKVTMATLWPTTADAAPV